LAFWNLQEVDRPLVGVYLGGYLDNDIYEVAEDGSHLLPDQLVSERFFELFWQDFLALQRIDQDLIYPIQPLSSIPWLEGMLGCPIRVGAQSVWAEQVLGKDQPLEGFLPEWLPAWIQIAEKSILSFSGHFTPIGLPVASPFLRGPADIIAALIGTDRLCYEIIDNPQEVLRLVEFCAQAWIRVSRLLISQLPAWRGGYVLGARWIYGPGPCTYSSEDFTGLISSKSYRKIFLAGNRLIASQFPYGFMHRHSPSLHHLEALLELQSGWAIEITMDPNGPKVAEILPVLTRIQQAGRPLIVFGLNDPDEVGRLVAGLSPRGLCVTVQADNEDQAKQLITMVRTMHEKVNSKG
jgi:hypothetical protein